MGLGICAVHRLGRWNLEKDITDLNLQIGTEITGGNVDDIIYQDKEYCYRENLINILCMGIDKEEPMAMRNDADSSMGQADAIFLLSIDLEQDKIRLIAIPRDTMVTLQKYTASGEYLGQEDGQITLQYAYGDGCTLSATLMAQQVSSILNHIPIHGYAAINVYSLWGLNAAVGGVDVTMDADYTAFNPAFIEGETVHLEGNLLENYIRERDKSDPDGAYTRMHRMKIYMMAFFEKAKGIFKEDMTLPVRFLSTLKDNLETDITADEVVYLVSKVIECSFLAEDMYTLPGDNLLIDGYMEYHLDKAGVMELVLELFYEENNPLAFWK